jgi:hypothetical protein
LQKLKNQEEIEQIRIEKKRRQELEQQKKDEMMAYSEVVQKPVEEKKIPQYPFG